MRQAAGCRLIRDLMLALLVLLPLSVRAVAQDMWRVSDIPVDVTAADAVTARARAIENGQREGLRRLLQRLTAAGDTGRLPSVEGVPVGPYVRSFEITGEKVGPTRYIASLSVTYNPDVVERLLRGRGVGYVATSAPTILVVPAVRQNGQLVLWQEDDPWRAAWEAAAAREEGMRIVLPLGDVNDMGTVTASRVESNGTEALAQLAARYEAAEAVLAIAEPRGGGVAVRFRTTGNGIFRGEPAALPPVPGTGPEAYERAAGAAASRLAQAWKRDTIASSERPTRINVTVFLADLAGWLQIKRDLDAIPEVREVRVDSFARSRAELTLSYAGEVERLREVLSRRGYALASESGGWQLRAAGGQQGLRRY